MKALMERKIRFLSALLVFFTLLAFLAVPASATAPSADGCSAAMLYNLNNEKLLFSKNPDCEIYPASTVKLMAGLMFCEALAGRLDEKIVLTADMLRGAEGRRFQLSAGQTLTVKDLLYIAICGAFNDAYTALAVIVGGSTDNFVEEMNKKARELGASSTNFTNVTGMHDKKMVTTARDILKISVEAAKNELLVNISSTYTYIVNFSGGTTRTVENRNMLHVPKDYGSEWYNSHAYGLCSGMTDEGGYCISVKGVFDKAEYICIVMGAQENGEYGLATALLEWASESYSLFTLKKKGDKIGDIPVMLSGTHSQTALRLESDISVLLKNDSAQNSDYKYVLSLDEETVSAPTEKGQRVGYMNVWLDGQLIACVGVTVEENIERNPFLTFMEGIKAFLGGRVFLSSLVFLAIIIVIMLFISYMKPKIRRKKYRVRLR